MNGKGSANDRKRRRKFSGQVKAAGIGALGAIIAAVITGVLAGNSGHLKISISDDLRTPRISTVISTVTSVVTETAAPAGDEAGGEIAPGETPLTELEALGRRPMDGPVKINDINYTNSISEEVGGCRKSHTFDYEIGRNYSHFRAMVGLASGADPDTVVRFEVFVDNKKLVESPDLGVGEDHDLTADVTDGFILRIVATEVAGDLGICGTDGEVAWGNASLRP